MHEVIFFDVHPVRMNLLIPSLVAVLIPRQLLNSSGVLLLTQAVLLLQPTSSQKQKTLGTHFHFALNLVGVIALIAGLVVIEINKGTHAWGFESVHGKLGLITYILIILQAIIGFVQFYIPETVFGSVEKAKAIYKYHRMSGYLILLMALATVCAATQTDFNKNVLGIQLWAVLVASVLVVLGVGARVKRYVQSPSSTLKELDISLKSYFLSAVSVQVR